MAKRFPINPPHPERTCWGCDQYCSAQDLRCGNGSDRTQHPIETFGPGWEAWAPLEAAVDDAQAPPSSEAPQAPA